MNPPLVVRRAAFSSVLVLVAVSVAVTVLAGFRPGGYVLAVALLAGAAARAFLPEHLCLGLLNRSRRVDVGFLVVLGVAVAAAAGAVPA